MWTKLKAELVSWLEAYSSTSGVCVSTWGFAVLLGWTTNIAFLRNLLPDPATLDPSSALCFALAGLSLWFLSRKSGHVPSQWIAGSFALVVIGIGAASLAADFRGWNLGLSGILYRPVTGGAGAIPPQIPGVTALNFLLIGFALALHCFPTPRRIVYAQCGVAYAGLQSLFFLMDYAYRGLFHSTSGDPSTLSLPKTLGFLVIIVGVLCARPDRGLMAVSTDPGAGGRLFRRCLAITLVVPFVLGWLVMVGQRTGFYGTVFELALVVIGIVGVFLALIWTYARSLVAADRKREQAESFLAGQKQIFEMISRGVPLPDTLSALVRLMESQAEGYVCSILLLDRDGIHLRHGAAPGLPQSYTQAIDGRSIGPAAGSCGTAAFRKEQVLVQDIGTDPLWADYKDLALAIGLRACWSTPIFDENHDVLGTFAIYDARPLDISPHFRSLVDVATYTAAVCIRHHRAEELLRQNLLHLSTVYNSVADIIFQVRVQGEEFRFVTVNPAFYRATGLAPAQVLGRPVGEVIPEPSLSLVLEKYREAIATRQTVRWEEETRYPAETKFGDVTVTPVCDADGQCTFLIGSVHDVTERKRLEGQFRQAQKMEVVGQLAGGVAHDFNNLLTVINGYSEIMLERLPPSDANYSFVQEVKKAGERAASLTHQLLAFSRRQVLQPQVINLNAVITDMEKMLRRLIRDDIHLVTVETENLGMVKADRGQVEQIILNLAVNARDAMPQGGKLTIETANVTLDETYAASHLAVKSGPHVMLAVSDTGTGMTPEVQKHIFEPFFTTKEVGKGTGLGLSTVYGIVKQSEGNIWVYSEPGLGTTFKVYLPRVDAPVEIVETATVEAKMPGGTETILLVEDEPSVRLLVRTTLESNGYHVLEATNGAEALLIGEQHQGRIHFLLTDLVMPGISGRVLAEQLSPGRPELKVLFLSGYTDDVVVRHGVLSPGMAFLQKPFTPDALARKVREVMDQQPKP